METKENKRKETDVDNFKKKLTKSLHFVCACISFLFSIFSQSLSRCLSACLYIFPSVFPLSDLCVCVCVCECFSFELIVTIKRMAHVRSVCVCIVQQKGIALFYVCLTMLKLKCV